LYSFKKDNTLAETWCVYRLNILLTMRILFSAASVCVLFVFVLLHVCLCKN